MKYIRETSDKVADIIIQTAGIEFNQNTSILEPSAGDGKLIDRLFETYVLNKEEINITCVELNKEKYECLVSKGYSAYNQDFLSFKSINKFSRIIACPPFKNNIDLEHIKHMYDLLQYKGIMVSLTSPHWVTNNETTHVEFRKWLEDKDYYFKMLPDNSFMEKNKTQPTGLLKIIKK